MRLDPVDLTPDIERKLQTNRHLNVDLIRVNKRSAKRLLDMHPEKQRNLSQLKVESYANDIDAGNWRMAGDTLKISETGKLLDGQHRLHAIINSDATVLMIVVSGLPDEVFDVIDTGKPRTLADVLAIEKYANTNQLAAIVRALFYFQHWGQFGRDPNLYPSHSDLMHVARDISQSELEVMNSFHSGQLAAMRTVTAISMPAAMYITLCRANSIDPADVHQFFMDVATGELLFKGDPAHTLRERLRQHRGDRQRRLHPRVTEAFFRIAWAKRMAGEELKIMRWLDDQGMPPLYGAQ